MTLVRVVSEQLAEDIGCEVGAVFESGPVDGRWFDEDGREFALVVIEDVEDEGVEPVEWFAHAEDVEKVKAVTRNGY